MFGSIKMGNSTAAKHLFFKGHVLNQIEVFIRLKCIKRHLPNVTLVKVVRQEAL